MKGFLKQNLIISNPSKKEVIFTIFQFGVTRFFIPGRPEENVLDLSTDYEACVLW